MDVQRAGSLHIGSSHPAARRQPPMGRSDAQGRLARRTAVPAKAGAEKRAVSGSGQWTRSSPGANHFRSRTPPATNTLASSSSTNTLGVTKRKEARINAAAQELKVAADLARQQAAEDRRKAPTLMSKLAKVVIQQAEVIDLKSDLTLDETTASRYSTRTPTRSPNFCSYDIGPLQ